jgi:hypothetical protein
MDTIQDLAVPLGCLALLIGVFVLYTRYDAARRKKRAEELAARLADLTERFGETDAKRILDKMVWTGQTAEMLRESLGDPVAVDRRVLKTKTKEVWKYRPMGQGRYATRVTVEDGAVIGSDIKDAA